MGLGLGADLIGHTGQQTEDELKIGILDTVDSCQDLLLNKSIFNFGEKEHLNLYVLLEGGSGSLDPYVDLSDTIQCVCVFRNSIQFNSNVTLR